MGVWNISDWPVEKFTSFSQEFVDDLLDEIYNDLLYFIYKSDHIRQKYASVFELILEELNTNEPE